VNLSIREVLPFLNAISPTDLGCGKASLSENVSGPRKDDNSEIPGKRKQFPPVIVDDSFD